MNHHPKKKSSSSSSSSYFLRQEHPPWRRGIIHRKDIQDCVAHIPDINRSDAAINHGKKEKEAEENRHQEECFLATKFRCPFCNHDVIWSSAKC